MNKIIVDGIELTIGKSYKEWWDYNEKTNKDFVNSGIVYMAHMEVGKVLGIEFYWSSEAKTEDEFIKEIRSITATKI